MANDDAFAVGEPVYVWDWIEVKPGEQAAVDDLFASVYQPLAAERGLVLLERQWCPPLTRSGQCNHLLLKWQYTNLGALWGARGVEETDLRLQTFWRQDIAPRIVSRERHLSRPDLNTDLPPRGPAVESRAPAAGLRRVVFLKPEQSLTVAAQGPWVQGIEGMNGRPGIRASAGGVNEGGYTGRPGELTWDIVADAADLPIAELEPALPGKVTVEEVVTIGECLGWGYESKPMPEGIKRTILLKVKDSASSSDIEKMEQILIEWAQQLPEMVSWSLSRVASSTGAVDWSHCYEQEFTHASAVTEGYLNHPFHWAVADRYFHPEAHEQTADVFFHSIRPASRAMLGPVCRGEFDQ